MASAAWVQGLHRLFLCAGLLLVLLAGCTSNSVATSSITSDPNRMGINGRITDPDGTPVSGAFVYAYRNQRSNLRGPADFEAAADPDGHYALDLVEGAYYLVSRQRHSGADAGPPRVGDAWALPERNPVTVKTNQLTTVDFVLQGIAQPMLMREGTLTSGDTGFTGQLLDSTGRPLPGAFVIAYPTTDFHRMPEATSPTVGADGRFTLFVARPGQWCLAARTRTRGQPIAGEPYGLLPGEQGPCRQIEAGRLLEIGTIALTPYQR